MTRRSARVCGVATMIAMLVICATNAMPQGNSVVVESKSVLPGQTDVEVGVYVSNAVKITAIVLPFEIRSVDPSDAPHAFTSGPATLNLNPTGRVYSSPLGPNSPSGIPASTSRRWYHQPGGPSCSGPVSGTYAVQDTTPDNVSPDGCMLFSNSYQSDIGDDVDLDPGAEEPGTHVPSLLFRFDVNNVPGRFEIDTCCVRPAYHLAFVDFNSAPVIPSFTKGVITIGTPPDNSVVVESKEVIPGQTNVSVGVYISNTVDITAIVLPFEFRTIGSAVVPHAFTEGPVMSGWNPVGRAYTSALGTNSAWGFPAWISNQRYPDTGGTVCSGPISGTYLTADGSPDNLSPDGSSFIAVAMGCGEACDDYAFLVMFAGQEVPGVNEPSFMIQFDVNNAQGQFEIDTCCVRPANHLYFIDRNTAIVPDVHFTKGIISIGCFCRCHGDPDCNGYLDIVDVVRTINTAFRGSPSITDQDCTHARTDVDANAMTNVLDVARMIDVVFGGESQQDVFVDPCAE